MKTRYLLLFLPPLALLVARRLRRLADARSPNVEARLRNNLPAACTAEQAEACPAVERHAVPAGQEPVIDYSADCCAHFTCQPLCSAAQQRTCPMTPAPICPAGTKLWIGTAIEDCCPAYRCEPDGTTCDPATEMCGCDATNVACTLALPYCGPNVQPIVVGQTADCCPIYQCPCDKAVDADRCAGAAAEDHRALRLHVPRTARRVRRSSARAWTTAWARARAARRAASARTIRSCAAGEKCDVSACRLPPMTTTTTIRSRRCATRPSAGPQLGLPDRHLPGRQRPPARPGAAC